MENVPFFTRTCGSGEFACAQCLRRISFLLDCYACVCVATENQAKAAQYFAAILLQGGCKTRCVALKFTTWKKKRFPFSKENVPIILIQNKFIIVTTHQYCQM